MEDITVLPHHFGMSVSDLDAAIDWFARVLGFELDHREDFLAAQGVHIALVRRGDFCIEFLQHDRAESASQDRSVPNEDVRTLGNKHMCFQISDMDAMVQHLKANGVTMAMGPFEAPGSVGAFVLGPDGALVELLELRP